MKDIDRNTGVNNDKLSNRTKESQKRNTRQKRISASQQILDLDDGDFDEERSTDYNHRNNHFTPNSMSSKNKNYNKNQQQQQQQNQQF